MSLTITRKPVRFDAVKVLHYLAPPHIEVGPDEKPILDKCRLLGTADQKAVRYRLSAEVLFFILKGWPDGGRAKQVASPLHMFQPMTHYLMGLDTSNPDQPVVVSLNPFSAEEYGQLRPTPDQAPQPLQIEVDTTSSLGVLTVPKLIYEMRVAELPPILTALLKKDTISQGDTIGGWFVDAIQNNTLQLQRAIQASPPGY